MEALRIYVMLFLAFSATVSIEAQLLERNPPLCEVVLSELVSKRITQVFQSLNVLSAEGLIQSVLCIDPFAFR